MATLHPLNTEDIILIDFEGLLKFSSLSFYCYDVFFDCTVRSTPSTANKCFFPYHLKSKQNRRLCVMCSRMNKLAILVRFPREKGREAFTFTRSRGRIFHTTSRRLSVVDVVIIHHQCVSSAVSEYSSLGHPIILSLSQDEDGSRFQFFMSGKFLIDLINSHFFCRLNVSKYKLDVL